MSEPVRTCVACRAREPKRALIRVARGVSTAGATPGAIVDPRCRLPGRGAYVHREAACVDRALDRGRLARALRVALAPAEAAALRRAFAVALGGALGVALGPGRGGERGSDLDAGSDPGATRGAPGSTRASAGAPASASATTLTGGQERPEYEQRAARPASRTMVKPEDGRSEIPGEE